MPATSRTIAGAVPRNLRGLITVVVWVLRPRGPVFWTRPFVQRRARKHLQDEAVLVEARKAMAHLLAPDATPEQVEEEARRHVVHNATWTESRWHPRHVADQRLEGVEHLRRAHAEGRGVLLSWVHHGQYSGITSVIAREGFHVSCVIAMSSLRSPGPNTIQHLRLLGGGGSLLPADGGVAGLQEDLAKGYVVASAIDVPGPTVVEFNGRQVRCSAGGLVAAARSGAPVVAVTSHREGDGIVLRLSEPLYAADFASIDAFAQELVRRHEPAILAWPTSAYLPHLAWAPVETDR